MLPFRMPQTSCSFYICISNHRLRVAWDSGYWLGCYKTSSFFYASYAGCRDSCGTFCPAWAYACIAWTYSCITWACINCMMTFFASICNCIICCYCSSGLNFCMSAICCCMYS